MKEWLRDEVTTNSRLAGQVIRYHTWPVLRQQTVGEHSWQIMRIFCKLFGSPRDAVWEYIMVHDMGEIAVGDVPFPVKSKNPKLKAEFDALEDKALEDMGIKIPLIYNAERWQIKICDLLEMMEFGLEEMQLGNRFAEPIVKATASAVRKMTEENPENASGASITNIKTYTMSTISMWTGERGHVV